MNRAVVVASIIASLPFAVVAQPTGAPPSPETQAVAWPEVTQTARPWTRWWWLGSAVDEPNLTRLLEEYRDAGIGGVIITCIYGVQGNVPKPNVPVRRLGRGRSAHAARSQPARHGRRFAGGFRLADGGPSVTAEDANSRLVIERQALAGGDMLTKRFGKDVAQAIVARAADGQSIDLSSQMEDNAIEWRVPPGRLDCVHARLPLGGIV